MFVEIGINTIKSDYFKTKEDVEKVLNICKSLNVDYSANFLNPPNNSEVRIVCSSVKKAKELLKLLKQSNINCDHFITKKKNKDFIKKIKIWSYSSDKEKYNDVKEFFDRIGYTNYINYHPDDPRYLDMTQFVVECYDNDFSIISEYFYMSDIDLYDASDRFNSTLMK